MYKARVGKASNWLPVFNQPVLYKGLEEAQRGWRSSEKKRGKRMLKFKGHCAKHACGFPEHIATQSTVLRRAGENLAMEKCRTQPETGCVSTNGWLQLLQLLDCILKVDWQSVPGIKSHFLVPGHSQLWLGAACLGRILPWRMCAFYLYNFAEKSRILVLTS